MFCSKCGVAMPDQTPSCPRCGATAQATGQPASVPPAQAAPQVSPYYNLGATQQPQYAVPYPGQIPQSEGKATASMILGILSLTCFGFLTGIPAIILGHMAKANIRDSGGRLEGDGKATAGLIMGYLSLFTGFIFLAAIIVPNLVRTRNMSYEKSAISSVHILNTSQSSYSIAYPEKGFASSLTVLGPGPAAVDCTVPSNVSAEHACLIDAALGCADDFWCVRSGYRFHLNGICADGVCSDYVITATPSGDVRLGIKSLCSTSDGVVRQRQGILSTPLARAEDCRSWRPLL